MKAVKYTKVETLPANAISVANFATMRGISVPYVYIKYDRSQLGKTTADYSIINYQGINFVLVDSNG